MKKMHRSILSLLLTLTMLCSVCTSAFAATAELVQAEAGDGIVQIVNGPIQGVPSDTEGVTVFKGVPFAQPPVGDLRWKAPQDLEETWTDVRVCDTWGNQAMQLENLNPVGGFWGDEFYFDEAYNPEISEDCLYLNVYKPENADAGELPVMVWIHGGGYDHGHASEMEFNASKLAAEGIIVVCIQYRVNVFGFLALPELSEENNGVSGNYGTLDQVKALEWVSQNIEAFGGDKDNVTICGQSAGAMSVTALLSTPLTKGLYNRAIVQSGFGGYAAPGSYTTLEKKQEACQAEIEKAFGEGTTLEDLRAMDAKDFFTDFGVYTSLKNAAGSNTLDGYVFTEESIDLTRDGALDGIDVMIGGTADEYTSLAGNPNGEMDIEAFHLSKEQQYGDLYNRSIYNPKTEKEAYRMNFRAISDGSLAKYRISAQLGKTRNEDHNAYVYYFDHDLAPHDPEIVGDRDEEFYGSFHSCELWFMFNSMRDGVEGQRLWTEDDHYLADTMSSYWANFVKTGDPNGEGLPGWEECTSDTDGAFMHFKDTKDGAAAICTTRSDFPARDRLMMKVNMNALGLTEDDLLLPYAIPFGDIPAELVTEVQEEGQRVIEINLTYDGAVDPDSVSKNDYKVKASLTYGDGKSDMDGYRTITDVKVNGNIVTLVLDPNDAAAVTSFYNGTTNVYDLSYLVTQKGEIETENGTVEPAKYRSTKVTNKIVDDFQSGSVSNTNGKTINFKYYDPIESAGAAADGSYPLILFLHGSGESGSNNLSQIIANKGAVSWVEPDRVAQNPVYVLAPQCPTAREGWINQDNQDLVIKMVDEFAATHNVDTSRIYIQGLSMGGIGTWKMILDYPEKFAAAIPICGRVPSGSDYNYFTDNGGAAFDALAELPIWVAHAADDGSVNIAGSRDAVAALRAHGNTSVKFYEYLPGAIVPNPHHSWKAVYEDQEIYNWLFEQNTARNHKAESPLKTQYTMWEYGGVQAILDYDVDPMWVLVNGDRAVLIDTGMGRGNLYDYLKSILPESVKKIDVILTHNHGDHIGQIADFKNRDDVEHIYIGTADAKAVLSRMGEDAGKVVQVDDGDKIPFGNKDFTVIDVAGHTAGSMAYMIDDKLFTGDAIGTGYVWMQIGDRSIEEYAESLQHLNDVIGDRDLTVYGGHTQYRGVMTDQYVRDILACAKGIVDGSIEGTQYLRGGVRNALQASYGTAAIIYKPDWVLKNSIWADLTTEVFGDGQKVVSATITYPDELDAAKASQLARRAFQVEARLTAGVESFNNVGMRRISGVKVDGKTITLTFDQNDGLGATSYFDYMSFQTSMYDLTYTIRQTMDLPLANGDTAKAATCQQRSVKNLVVDDFKAASISNGKLTIPYRYYDPVAVNKVDKEGKYPLILFLHGAGESGTNNNAQLIANKGAVAWAEADRIAQNPCYVLAPQSPGFSVGGWQGEGMPELLMKMIEEFVAAHPQVDMDRIYIEGMSMGGMGTWNMILTYPDFFAAAIPICGMVNDSVYETDNGAAFDALANLPIWVAHAEDDTTVNVSGSQKAVAALKAHGNTSVKYYEYLKGSITPDPHHSWRPVYEDQEIYNWLFEQNKARTDYGKINPKTLYTTWEYGGVQAILDYDVDPMWVLVNGDRAVLIDTGMGGGNLYDYLKSILPDTVKKIDVILTHKHGDHIGQIADFKNRDDVEHIYIGTADAQPVLSRMGEDAGKVVQVDDGDKIPFGNKEFTVIDVAGHTAGSMAYMIDDKLFTGDAIGTGYVWMQIGDRSIEEYIDSLQHLNDVIGDRDLTVYGGHTQYRGIMTDQYVHDILECAKGIVDGSIVGTQYLRGGVRNALQASYGTAAIIYRPDRILKDGIGAALTTEVKDDGQKVIQASITYENEIDPASVSKATYQVQATLAASDPKFDKIGLRTVTGVKVDGKTVTITLDPTDEEAVTSYYDGKVTSTYNLSYKVSQLADIKTAGGETVPSGAFMSSSVKNLIVDDFQSGKVTNEGGKTLNYRYFDPIKSAGVDKDGKYPLVLFLHGSGESGSNNLSHLIANKGAVAWAERTDMNPTYVLAPQCPAAREGWVNEANEALVMQMLDEFIEANADTIDTSRIYIQGLSMGGIGTWKIILDHPDMFAAAMPICGRIPSEYYGDKAEQLKGIINMPIWAFHAADDDSVDIEGTRQAVAALKAAGSKCIKFEEFTAGSIIPSHHVWKYVYSTGTPYNWLFDQTLERTENHTINPSMNYVHETVEPGVTVVRDYEMGQIWVLEQGDKAVVIDTGMGAGNLYDYIINEVLENKNAEIDVILTHKHGDHIGCLDDFIGSNQVKNVYVGQGDEDSIFRKMGADAGKVIVVKDGDKIAFGGETIEVVEVPGHTPGSIVLFHGDDVYTGDAVGSGDLWMQIGVCSIKTYIKSVQHFVDKIGDRKMNVRTGHAEYLEPFTEEYVKQILKCAEGIVDDSIKPTIYTRKDASYATYGRANIVYFPSQIDSVNKIELNRALAAAKILDENKYTSATWAVLMAAVNAANTLPSDAIQMQIDSAAAAVRAATAGLVEGTPTRDSVIIRYNGKAVSLTVNGVKQPLADKINCYKIPSAATELNLVFTPAVEGRTFARVVKDGTALDENAFAADSYKITISAEQAANGLETAYAFTIVNKQTLQTIIDAADAAVASGEYDKVVQAVKDLFDGALAKAKAIAAQKTASQEEIDEAGWKLLKAVQMLSFEAGNTDALKNLVALAEAMRDSGEYTDLNWQAFLDALAAAKLVADDPNALKADVEAASDALLTAIDNTLRKADKSSLEEVLAQAKETMQEIDRYVPADKAILEAAIKSAQAVMDNPYATQKEVEDTTLALTKTLTELRVIPKKDNLGALLEATKDIGPGRYTAASYQEFLNKRNAALQIMNDPNASQAQVDNAEAELREAKDKLTDRNNSTGGSSSNKGGSSGGKATIGDGTAVVTTIPNAALKAYVRSDTTLPFTVRRGQAYCFKMTVLNGNGIAPSFTVGNGSVLKTQFVTRIGNDYYFRIWAVGNAGQSTGVYTTLPGQAAVQHCTVAVA